MQTTLFTLRAGDEFIELYKVLKAEGLAEGGGEAKHAIGEGLVIVNGETELRKRRKLVIGDVINYQDTRIEIVSEA